MAENLFTRVVLPLPYTDRNIALRFSFKNYVCQKDYFYQNKWVSFTYSAQCRLRILSLMHITTTCTSTLKQRFNGTFIGNAYPWSNQREISSQMTLQHLTNYVFMLPCGNKRTRTTVSSPTLKPLGTSWHCNIYITLTWAAKVKVWARTWLFESHFNTWGCIIWCALVYCQWLAVHWRRQSKLLQQNWNKIIIITILYGISQCYLVQ